MVCRPFLLGAALALLLGIGPAMAKEPAHSGSNPAAVAKESAHTGPDPAAIAIANKTLEAMGGRSAWEKARVLQWRFMGKRRHHWDKATGDVRIEADSTLILMNVNSRKGRVWQGGTEVTNAEALDDMLEQGYGMWVNDSYWLIMPYKLLDPGVKLRHRGESSLPDGRAADLITMTFESVGLTPENKYDVWVAKDTGLVEQWAYYEKAGDAEPKFTLPWGGWKRFGPILLATERGRDADWEIAVFEERPNGVFEAR
jgi:hypothetical protein